MSGRQTSVATCARGLLMIRRGAFGGQIVRWLLPLIVDPEHVDTAADTFEQALKATQVA